LHGNDFVDVFEGMIMDAECLKKVVEKAFEKGGHI
jgi:hypothetical protein